VLLHAEVVLIVDGYKDVVFDLGLDFRGEFLPNVGVCGWAEIGEAESELRGGEVSAFEGCLA
jgi:hypothetical protein